MKENLENLLKELKEKEDARKAEVNKLNSSIDRINQREKYQIDNFKEGMQNDRDAGVYMHITDGKFQTMLSEEEGKIKQNFENEREAVNEELKQKEVQYEKERMDDYKKVSPVLTEYHMNMRNESGKAKAELDKIISEQKEKLQEIENKISEKEAERTRIIIKNRNSIDNQFASFMVDVNALDSELQDLNEQKESMNKDYNGKKENQNKYIEDCLEQVKQSAKFLGLNKVTDQTINDIYDSLYGNVKDIDKKESVENEEEKSEEVEEQVVDVPVVEETTTAETTESKESEETVNKSEEKSEPETTNANQVVTQAQQTNNSEQVTVNNLETEADEKFSIILTSKGYQYSEDSEMIAYDEDAYRYNVEYEEDKKEERMAKLNKALEGKLEPEDIEFLQEHGDLSLVNIMCQHEKSSEILKEYIKMIKNPSKESKLSIKYDLTKSSIFNRIASIFKKDNSLKSDQISELKNMAYNARGYAEVEVGTMTKLAFKIKDMIKNSKQRKIAAAQEKTSGENTENIESAKVVKDDKNIVERLSSLFTKPTESQKNIADSVSDIQNQDDNLGDFETEGIDEIDWDDFSIDDEEIEKSNKANSFRKTLDPNNPLYTQNSEVKTESATEQNVENSEVKTENTTEQSVKKVDDGLIL